MVKASGRQRHVAVAIEIAHRHAGHLEPAPGAHRDVVGVLVEQTDHRRADGAAAEQPDADRPFAHASSPGRPASSPIQTAISISSSSP